MLIVSEDNIKTIVFDNKNIKHDSIEEESLTT